MGGLHINKRLLRNKKDPHNSCVDLCATLIPGELASVAERTNHSWFPHE